MKNKNKQKSKAFILPLALMIILLSIALLTNVMRRVFVFQDNIQFFANNEKAKTMALSGIQIGMAQLSSIIPKEGSKESKAPQTDLSPEQEWLYKVLLKLNRWQSFTLKKEVEGIDCQLEIYISCEQGKINLNKLVDSPKQVDSKEGEQAAFGANYGAAIDKMLLKDFQVSILDVLKESKKRLERENSASIFEDPTELLLFDQFKKFKDRVFMIPQVKGLQEKKYLTDIFTVETRSEKLNPWVLSASVSSMLGFTQLSDLVKQGKEKIIKESVKKWNQMIFWPANWDAILKPIYGKDFSSINKDINVLFSPQFEANSFSVISYAKIGKITQKICAILERRRAASSISPQSIVFRIKKLYWL